MENFNELFDFLKTPFPYLFLVLSLSISIALLTSDDFVQLLKHKMPKTEIVKVSVTNDTFEEGENMFVSCYINNGTSLEDVLYGVAKFFGFFLIFPSVIAANLFIVLLQRDFPNLSVENLVLIGKIAFVYFNLNYWLLLSYLIKSFHEAHLKDKIPSNPFISILPKM